MVETPRRHLLPHASESLSRLPLVRIRPKRTAAIDTSALSNVLSTNSFAEKFALTLYRTSVEVFISDTVINELTSTTVQSEAARQIRTLQRLVRAAEGVLWNMPFTHKVIEMEVTEGVRGVDDLRWGWEILLKTGKREIRRISRRLDAAAEWLHNNKKALFRIDRTTSIFLRDEKGLNVTVADVMNELERRIPNPVHRTITKAVELSKPRLTAEQIVADSQRFKVIHAQSHLLYRLAWANAVQPDSAYSQDIKARLTLWRTRSSNKGIGIWEDSRIAAGAARFDLLISDDENQRGRCEFLRERGLVGFKSISLNDFMA